MVILNNDQNFCPNCGKRLGLDELICSNCNTIIDEIKLKRRDQESIKELRKFTHNHFNLKYTSLLMDHGVEDIKYRKIIYAAIINDIERMHLTPNEVMHRLMYHINRVEKDKKFKESLFDYVKGFNVSKEYEKELKGLIDFDKIKNKNQIDLLVRLNRIDISGVYKRDLLMLIYDNNLDNLTQLDLYEYVQNARIMNYYKKSLNKNIYKSKIGSLPQLKEKVKNLQKEVQEYLLNILESSTITEDSKENLKNSIINNEIYEKVMLEQKILEIEIREYSAKLCPNCYAKAKSSFIYCEICGVKLE